MDPGHPRVNQVDSRERRQGSRIAKGDRSGELINRETAHVDRRENRIQFTKARDMRNDGGHLIRTEQRHLDLRQTTSAARSTATSTTPESSDLTSLGACPHGKIRR